MKRRAKPAKAQDEYSQAFAEILSRIQQTLKGSQPGVFPIRMYIAGGGDIRVQRVR